MNVLYIETFYGGSHRYFADRWIEESRHSHELHTLPPRFWKWRQAGSALYLAETIPRAGNAEYDVMVISGMIDLAHLKTLRPDLPPALLYIHENQFSYPLQKGEQRDYRYGLTDLVNMLSAEKVVFNSAFNRDSFLQECRELFRKLPDALPRGALDTVMEKSVIIYPGIDTPDIDLSHAVNTNEEPPLIIWNHRHEHDKNPQTAFGILERLKNRGFLFRLALLGERFSKTPEAFSRARSVLKENIVIDDYPTAQEYRSWLKRGDIVISSAVQENFGLSVIEAAAAGCWPLLPRRLAYPEVMPGWVSRACFWNDERELEQSLEKLLGTDRRQRESLTVPLSRWLKRYLWKYQARKLDEILEETGLPDQGLQCR